MPESEICALIGWLAAALGCAILSGCGSNGQSPHQSGNATAFAAVPQTEMSTARIEAMDAADSYVTVLAEAVDNLQLKTKRPEVVDWAMQQRVAAASASFADATRPNGYVGLMDMMVLATLKREAVEDHWIPALLHEEGTPVLEAYRRGEDQVWVYGAKVLSGAQCSELRTIIEKWRKANPTQYYVSHMRFTELADAMHVTADSSLTKAPGSIFGLLYIDPLAGLDPVAKELQQYRALTERIVYLVNRLPLVFSSQADAIVYHATHDEQVVGFIANTSRFSDATVQFSQAVARMPKALAAERAAAIEQLDAAAARQRKAAIQELDVITAQQRKAAIDQLFTNVTQQRQALEQDMNAEESHARTVIADMRGVVDRADEAGRSLNASTSLTVGVAELATRRTLNHAFVLAVALLLVILMSLLCYQLMVKRCVQRRDVITKLPES